MKVHTTNYIDTLIEIAEDCKSVSAELPPIKSEMTIANYQFEKLKDKPYHYTSDELIFEIHAIRNDISPSDLEAEKALFFSKGQACLRASPLGKRYGWGIHANTESKIALIACETPQYQELLNDSNVKKVKAMKSSR
jgi:hypothetical protein